MLSVLSKLWKSEDGATAIEYGLIAPDRGCGDRRVPVGRDQSDQRIRQRRVGPLGLNADCVGFPCHAWRCWAWHGRFSGEFWITPARLSAAKMADSEEIPAVGWVADVRRVCSIEDYPPSSSSTVRDGYRSAR